MQNLKTIGFKMQAEEKEQLEQVAKNQGRSLSGQIRFILSAYLSGQEVQNPVHHERKNHRD